MEYTHDKPLHLYLEPLSVAKSAAAVIIAIILTLIILTFVFGLLGMAINGMNVTKKEGAYDGAPMLYGVSPNMLPYTNF